MGLTGKRAQTINKMSVCPLGCAKQELQSGLLLSGVGEEVLHEHGSISACPRAVGRGAACYSRPSRCLM